MSRFGFEGSYKTMLIVRIINRIKTDHAAVRLLMAHMNYV